MAELWKDLEDVRETLACSSRLLKRGDGLLMNYEVLTERLLHLLRAQQNLLSELEFLLGECLGSNERLCKIAKHKLEKLKKTRENLEEVKIKV